VLAAIASWFSIASGPIATAAVAAWAVWCLVRGDGSRRQNAITLIAAMILTGIGLGFRLVKGMPGGLEAESFSAFLTVFAGLLSWPVQSPAAAAIMYLPFVLLLGKSIRNPSREGADRAVSFLIPLGLWVILESAALAYARNRYGEPLEISRYMSFLAPGVPVNLGCVAVLARDWTLHPLVERRRTLLFSVTVLALGLVLFNLGRLTREAFLASGGNPKTFEGKTVHDLQAEFIPELMDLLRNPALRRILPARLQPPLKVAPEQVSFFELVARRPSVAGEIVEPVWTTLQPLADGQTAIFRSKQIVSPLPYIELAVTGRPAADGAALALVGGGESVVLGPGTREPGTPWSRVIVAVPASPFQIEAVCRGGSDAGFAFTLPRPVGRLSGWAHAVMQRDVEIIAAGLLLWIALGLAERFQRTGDRG
jgi:hypothetical protein